MPSNIGKYEIIRVLGEGAMGKVYLGRDPSLGREVAIKTIRPETSLGAEARQRFDREARAAGALSHPNLVTIHEFGEDAGTLFIVMEYLPGEDLQAVLRGQHLTPSDILEVIAQVCDGLAYAHARGVMHRDIKPSNVQVHQDMGHFRAKVMDFGIARIAGSDMTGTGTLLGTFGYMAPEYIQSGLPDHRSDLFAVGVMLYEALSGQRPFDGDTTATVLYRIVHEQPKPLEPNRLQGISPHVSAILHRALAKDPTRRFQSAQEMAAAVRGAKDPFWLGYRDLDGAPTVISTRTGRTAEPEPKPGKHRFRTAGFLVAGLLLAGGGAAAALHWKESANPPAVAQVPMKASAPAASLALKPEPPPVLPEKATPTAPPILQKTEAKPEPPVAAPAATAPVATAPVAPPPPVPKAQILDRVAQDLEANPQAALLACLQVLAEEPDNLRAHAFRAVALYRLERYAQVGEALKEAKHRGIFPRQMMHIPRFAQVMAEELQVRRIPEDAAPRGFPKGGLDRKERRHRLPDRRPD